jgi:hypothetical protein
MIKRFIGAKIFALKEYSKLNDYPLQVTADACQIDAKSIVEYLATLPESHTQRNLLLVLLLNKGVAVYTVRREAHSVGEVHSVFEIIKNTQSVELMAAALAWAKIYEAILNRTNQDGLAQYKTYIQVVMNKSRAPSFVRGANIMDKKINIHLRRSVYRENIKAFLKSFCPEFLANEAQIGQDRRQGITEKVGSYFNMVRDALKQAEWMGYDNDLIRAVRQFAQICLEYATTSPVCARYGRAFQELSEPTRKLSLISIDKEDPTLVSAQQALAEVLDKVGIIVCMFYQSHDLEEHTGHWKKELAKKDRKIAVQDEQLQEKDHTIQEQDHTIQEKDQQLLEAKQELVERPTMEHLQQLTIAHEAQIQSLSDKFEKRMQELMQEFKSTQPQNKEPSASASAWRPSLL